MPKSTPIVPVVAIGTSAGGLKEIEVFFKNMPKTSAVAFVIIQHLSPHYKSLLAELVTRHTNMDVSQIQRKTTVKAGKVYIIPPNKLLTLEEGKLVLSPMPPEKNVHLPIDIFFRSMKEGLKEKAIAVVMSGTGSDGTLGIKAVKENGGLTLVQDPTTADYDGMPRNAIDTGLIDYVVAVDEMPELIIEYVENKFHDQPGVKFNNQESERQIQMIFEIIRDRTGTDFSNYKRNTVHRRIERRITVNKLKSLTSYVKLLKENHVEVVTLFKELLISVTSFFRDPEVFETVSQVVIPELFKNIEDNKIRIWVPACATGEEAYSLTILLQNHIDQNKLNTDLQVFASDIDAHAIETARDGYYPNNITTDIDEDLLNKYFVKEKSGFRVKKSIRQSVVFAEQNLLQDPPYSRLDLISCRNLLIYFNSEIQSKALTIFNYSLKERGFLVLGNSESIGNFTKVFDVVNRPSKVFRKSRNLDNKANLWSLNFNSYNHKLIPTDKGSEPVSNLAKDYIIDHHTPPSVVIDLQGNMIYVLGRTGKFLESSTGEASSDILKNTREGIKIPLSNAIRKVKATKTEFIQPRCRVKTNGDYELVDIIVAPLKKQQEDTNLLLVVFKTVSPKLIEEVDSKLGELENSTIIDLERELAEKERYLQNTIEELETTNEELKSSNEEAQSTNEELQSTNEELETSKEELQSVNEELSTTNNELNEKVDALYSANNDLGNLLDATNVATIFLNKELKIFNFTPSISPVVDLLKSDIGRSIRQFTNNLKYDTLVEDAKAVLKTLLPRESEVENFQGLFFWMKISPYRTTDDKIEGVVISFTDIIEKKKQERELEKYRNQLEELVEEKSAELLESKLKYRQIFDNTNDHIYILDVIKGHRFKIIASNPKLKEELGSFTEGKFVDECVSDETYDHFYAHFMKCLAEKKSIFFNEELFEQILNTQLIPLIDQVGKVTRIIGVARNVTEKVLAERALIKAKSLLVEAEIQAGLGNWTWDFNRDEMKWSEGMFNIFNIGEAKKPRTWGKLAPLFHKDDFEEIDKLVKKTINTGGSFESEARIFQPKKKERHVLIRGQANVNEQGTIDLIFGTIQDIHERKLAETQLKESELKYKKISELAIDYTYSTSFTKDVKTKVDWHFGAIKEITGYSAKELIGTKIQNKIIHPDDLEAKMERDKLILEGKDQDAVVRIITKGGQLKYIRERSYPQFNSEKNRVVQIIGTAEDVTAQKLVEEELIKAKQKAEENDKLKSAFLANMSHEIRTPMNGVLGFSNLLKKRDLSQEKRRQYIDIIQQNSHELLTLINDIIDVSKIEAGQLSLHPTACHPKKIIDDLLLVFNQLKKQKKKDRLEFVAEPDQKHLNLVVTCDPDRIKQILSNLLSNALKFTEKGKIVFGYTVKNNRLYYHVQDEGIGISEADQKLVFNRFEQGLEPRVNHEGTGLGLSIVQGIVQMLGGEVQLKSEPGKGSRFEFWIPLKQLKNIPKQEKENNPDLNLLNGKTILIADDNHVNNQLFDELFEVIFEGIDVRILYASSGENAIELVEKHPQIDVILMDIRMPGMGGEKAAEILLKKNPSQKIIAQTAYAMSHEKEAFLNNGFSDYISKPINEDELLQKLVKWANQ